MNLSAQLICIRRKVSITMMDIETVESDLILFKPLSMMAFVLFAVNL